LMRVKSAAGSAQWLRYADSLSRGLSISWGP
jgi:hypothetical protein